MIPAPDCLAACAVDVLTTADALEKAAKSQAHARSWFEGRTAGRPMPVGQEMPPWHPARPAKPDLLAPREMPRRRPGSAQGRKALLHAVAHIELNAVDLHWDMIARFTATPMPLAFYDDWVRTAEEEARHFRLLNDCLLSRGGFYGELPAHAQMWHAAQDTAGDLLARLAVAPMILEARGLDVTPPMIDLFRKAGEADALAALETIYAEEVAHVAHGAKWFRFLCERDGLPARETFHALARRYFHSALKPPFNEQKRGEAGLPPDFYWPLAKQTAG